MLTNLIAWNRFLWNGPVLILLLLCHICFTIRSHFVQRNLPQAARMALKTNNTSTFLALTTTLAATLGTGNILGVSTAVALGGPGAVFWCFLTGLLGMATTYAECNLSLQHRSEPGGNYGPMHLLDTVLHNRAAAILYALGLLVVSLCMNALTQSNALSISFSRLTGTPGITGGILAALLLAYLFFSGSGRLQRVCMILVPAMSLFFLLGCLILLATNLPLLFPALRTILAQAFGLRALTGGLAGYTLARALRQGVAKGLFTNEAGLGTAALGALENTESFSVNQSLVSMFATFFDTVFLCTLTGIVLVIGLLRTPEAYENELAADWILVAFSGLPFFGETMLHLCIVIFAFATMIGWYCFGEKAAAYLAGHTGKAGYRLCYLAMILFGSTLSSTLVWELADLLNICLLLPNLCLLWRMRRQVIYPP